MHVHLKRERSQGKLFKNNMEVGRVIHGIRSLPYCRRNYTSMVVWWLSGRWKVAYLTHTFIVPFDISVIQTNVLLHSAKSAACFL